MKKVTLKEVVNEVETMLKDKGVNCSFHVDFRFKNTLTDTQLDGVRDTDIQVTIFKNKYDCKSFIHKSPDVIYSMMREWFIGQSADATPADEHYII